MNLPQSTVRRRPFVVAGLLFLCSSAFAQNLAPGAIEGRVFNTLNGEYLERARVTLEGTPLEVFTDSSGQYRLTNVPAGAAKVKVFYTGQDAQTDVVTANASAQRATGDATSNFTYVPRTYNGGISLTREKFNVKFNWNYRSAVRQAQQPGRGLEPGTFEWGAKKMLRDIYADYSFTRHLGVFMSLRNVGSAPEDVKRYGPSTPPIARFRQRQDYGSAWIFGLKGTF